MIKVNPRREKPDPHKAIKTFKSWIFYTIYFCVSNIEKNSSDWVSQHIGMIPIGYRVHIKFLWLLPQSCSDWFLTTTFFLCQNKIISQVGRRGVAVFITAYGCRACSPCVKKGGKSEDRNGGNGLKFESGTRYGLRERIRRFKEGEKHEDLKSNRLNGQTPSMRAYR